MNMNNSKLDSSWSRLSRIAEIGEMPGLHANSLELVVCGVDLNKLGLSVQLRQLHEAGLSVGSHHTELPFLDGIALDISHPNKVRIMHRPDPAADPVSIAEGVFQDKHPEQWISALATDNRALLAISTQGPGGFKTQRQWTDTWRVGIVNLALYATASGVGIVA